MIIGSTLVIGLGEASYIWLKIAVYAVVKSETVGVAGVPSSIHQVLK